MPGQGILEPAWGPGDSLIAYRTLFAAPLMLRLHHVETDTSDSLFSSGMRNLRTPDWSPDGKRIAFQLSAGDTAANDEIWIYSLAERGRRGSGSRRPISSVAALVARRALAGLRVGRDRRAGGVRAPGVRLAVALRVSTAGGEFPFWRQDGRELLLPGARRRHHGGAA